MDSKIEQQYTMYRFKHSVVNAGVQVNNQWCTKYMLLLSVAEVEVRLHRQGSAHAKKNPSTVLSWASAHGHS